jgi:hypothetical protein
MNNSRGTGIPANGITWVGGMGRRPRMGSDFAEVRTAIGTALRSRHSKVLLEPLPDRMAELLGELDQQLRELDQQLRELD